MVDVRGAAQANGPTPRLDFVGGRPQSSTMLTERKLRQTTEFIDRQIAWGFHRTAVINALTERLRLEGYAFCRNLGVDFNSTRCADARVANDWRCN